MICKDKLQVHGTHSEGVTEQHASLRRAFKDPRPSKATSWPQGRCPNTHQEAGDLVLPSRPSVTDTETFLTFPFLVKGAAAVLTAEMEGAIRARK